MLTYGDYTNGSKRASHEVISALYFENYTLLKYLLQAYS
jgi:hypothetical protein